MRFIHSGSVVRFSGALLAQWIVILLLTSWVTGSDAKANVKLSAGSPHALDPAACQTSKANRDSKTATSKMEAGIETKEPAVGAVASNSIDEQSLQLRSGSSDEKADAQSCAQSKTPRAAQCRTERQPDAIQCERDPLVKDDLALPPFEKTDPE